MKAAIYCRVSTEDQEREGTSLDSQLEACQGKAQRLGYEISDKYTVRETYSGLSLDRPRLGQLRQWVKAKEVDAVVAYTLDRLSRDPVHFIILQEEMERNGVGLILVTEDLDSSDLGLLITHIKGYAAKLEAEKIKERTMRGKHERMKNGKLPTGRGILYGYDYDKQLGINIANDRLGIVRMIGQWLIQECISLNEVCRRLMERKIPAPKGGRRWSRSTVGRIMRNSTYAGKSYVCKTRIEGGRRLICPEVGRVLIPGAVDRNAFTLEEWELIQKQLDRNRQLSPRNQKLTYLLSGRLFCKLCGRKYYGVPLHGKPYYRCSGRARLLLEERCIGKTVNGRRLDEAVWSEVVKVLENPRTVMAGLEQSKNDRSRESFLQEELCRTTRKLKALDREQRELLQWAMKGFPEDIVVKENERINRDRFDIQRELAETERKLEETMERHIDLKKLAEFCRMVSQNLSGFGYAEKRLALEALKVKVIVDGDNQAELQGVLPIPSEVCAMSQPL
jgi:site-specific DNA recombinase